MDKCLIIRMRPLDGSEVDALTEIGPIALPYKLCDAAVSSHVRSLAYITRSRLQPSRTDHTKTEAFISKVPE